MSEYYFKHKSQKRDNVVEDFVKLSKALKCDEEFNFTFSTRNLASFNELMATLKKSEDFDISLEGKINLKSKVDFTPYYTIFNRNDIDLFNLTIYNQDEYKGDPEDEWRHEYTMPIVSITLLKREKHREIGIRINDHARNAKSKKKQSEIISFRMELFNAWLKVLSLDAQVVTKDSDGSHYAWPKGLSGVVLESKDKEVRSTLAELGCLWLTYSIDKPEDTKGILEKLLELNQFSKRKAEVTIYTKSPVIEDVLKTTKISFDEISSIVSTELHSDKSLLNAMTTIAKFEGHITMMRPYSFNNSLSDNLALKLSDKELSCFVDAGMASKNTIDKFLKKLSKELSDAVEFEE